LVLVEKRVVLLEEGAVERGLMLPKQGMQELDLLVSAG